MQLSGYLVDMNPQTLSRIGKTGLFSKGLHIIMNETLHFGIKWFSQCSTNVNIEMQWTNAIRLFMD